MNLEELLECKEKCFWVNTVEDANKCEIIASIEVGDDTFFMGSNLLTEDEFVKFIEGMGSVNGNKIKSFTIHI